MKINGSQHALIQVILALPVSLIVFSMVLLSVLVGFETAYADRVYPGVYVYDIELSGMTFEETDQKLTQALGYATEEKLVFTFGKQVWEAHPKELGYSMQPASSAQKAFEVGRREWFVSNVIEKARAWFFGIQLSPIAIYDERVALDYLQSIAAEIDQSVLEASLALDNTEVIVQGGQVGREVDIDGTLALISTYLTRMEGGEISIIVTETAPVIMEVGPQADLAQQILSKPLVLSAMNDGGETRTWTIAPADLASMLVITRADGVETDEVGFTIAINENLMNMYLSSLAPGLLIETVNSRFIFNDESGLLDLLEPAVIGQELDIKSSVEHINTQLMAGQHDIDLQFTSLIPDVTDDMTGEALGITELVHQETTYFYGSEAARVQNIRASSARFHGLLVAPGETFSMAQALGNISLDSGYAEALIIYGGQTIRAVGGGVCQVSTTLFRTAFFAGFPIVERHAHSYRVGYYEMRPDGSRDTRLAGLDAAVYVPIVDLKFTNDTENWLLMETYVGNFALTWKFYSTSDGRTVEWSTTGPTNVVPAPEPLYRENPELTKGVIKQVDYSADGADVTVTRTVYKGDQIHFSDSIYTHFQPWQAIFEYGPGTEGIPEPNGD